VSPRRLDAGCDPVLDPDGRHRNAVRDRHAGTAGREGQRAGEPRRRELAVAGERERGAHRSREAGFPSAHLLARNDLERQAPGALPVERPVEDDLLRLGEGDGEASPDVVFARESCLLFQSLHPVAEQVTGEERQVPERLRRRTGPRLGVDEAGRPGDFLQRADGTAIADDGRFDTPPGEFEGEGKGDQAGADNDDVGALRVRRRRWRSGQATSPRTSTTGPVPGTSGGP
jgi:hypothetical protein